MVFALQVQHASAQKEQEMCDHMETLKVSEREERKVKRYLMLILVPSSNQISHGQELEHMQQKLLHMSAKLEQKVTQLQV